MNSAVSASCDGYHADYRHEHILVHDQQGRDRRYRSIGWAVACGCLRRMHSSTRTPGSRPAAAEADPASTPNAERRGAHLLDHSLRSIDRSHVTACMICDRRVRDLRRRAVLPFDRRSAQIRRGLCSRWPINCKIKHLLEGVIAAVRPNTIA